VRYPCSLTRLALRLHWSLGEAPMPSLQFFVCSLGTMRLAHGAELAMPFNLVSFNG